MSNGDFAGKRALVTGGASGIGLGTAQLLAAEGARVAVLDVAAPPDGLDYAQADVTDDATVRQAVSSVVGRFGGLDVLVNCAGIGAQGGVEANSDEEWHRVFDVNVVGMVRVTRACLPALRASGSGVIVNVGSIAGTAGLPNGLYIRPPRVGFCRSLWRWRRTSCLTASACRQSTQGRRTRRG